MSRAWTRSSLAALVTVLAAAPAFAHTPAPPGGGCRVIRGAQTPDPADDASVCRQDVYFHRGSAALGNLSEANPAALPSWNTTRPATALPDGGVYVSSGEYDIFAEEGGPAGRAQFAGTFTGPLDTLGFRFYLRSPFDEATGGSLGATVHLEIDGEVIHDNYDTAAVDLPLVAEEDLFRIDIGPSRTSTP